ncbi:MAG: helix-turn-helix domain-containing protein [Desulfuromusa sp.]|nr:helix-turn-helix domain-containing protein [Desulfuromusa sp.]
MERGKFSAELKDICRALQISERTLQRVFQKRYGGSPRFHINALRLNRVYKELRSASTGEENVVIVANRWGFWHMGQFAADYRKMFGELPSATLNRLP